MHISCWVPQRVSAWLNARPSNPRGALRSFDQSPLFPGLFSIIITAGRPFTGLSVCNPFLVMEDFYLSGCFYWVKVNWSDHSLYKHCGPSIDVVLSCCASFIWWQRLVNWTVVLGSDYCSCRISSLSPSARPKYSRPFPPHRIKKGNCNFILQSVFFVS